MKPIPLLEFSAQIIKGHPDQILEHLETLAHQKSAIEEKTDHRKTLKIYVSNRIEALKFKKILLNKPEFTLTNFKLKKIPFDRWATRWKKGLKIIRFSNRLIIRPSWIKYKRKNREKVILLDPEMAFGTGHHPTTRMCLEWLIPETHGWKNAFDIGCGSGILAIAAVKMGIQKAWGIDIDPEAIQVAKKNANLNRVSSKVRFLTSDLKKFKSNLRFDGVLANLTALDIKKNWKKILKFVKTGQGLLFLAGIEKNQQSWFEPWLKSRNKFKILETKTDSNWVGYKLLRI